jgi:hypothetical protein
LTRLLLESFAIAIRWLFNCSSSRINAAGHCFNRRATMRLQFWVEAFRLLAWRTRAPHFNARGMRKSAASVSARSRRCPFPTQDSWFLDMRHRIERLHRCGALSRLALKPVIELKQFSKRWKPQKVGVKWEESALFRYTAGCDWPRVLRPFRLRT